MYNFRIKEKDTALMDARREANGRIEEMEKLGRSLLKEQLENTESRKIRQKLNVCRSIRFSGKFSVLYRVFL